MCLLSYVPEYVQPDLDELLNGAIVNHDGHGYAIATPRGELIVRRTVNQPAMLLDRFGEDRKAHPAGPALFHSRFATSGTKDKRNVHPFYVGRDRSTVIAHNGVFFRTRGNMSDTAVFASEIMPQRFSAIDKPKQRRRLEKYLSIGYPNKLAVITVNPRYRHQGYTFGQGEYSQTSGVWHSNDDYMPWESNALWAKDIAGPGRPGEFCSVCCAEATIDPVSLVCDACHYCQDCQEHIYDCQCYSPTSESRPVPMAQSDRIEWAEDQARKTAVEYAASVRIETGIGWAGAEHHAPKPTRLAIASAQAWKPEDSAREEGRRRIQAIKDAQAAFAADDCLGADGDN